MANPWDNDPIIQPMQAAPMPWDKDPIVSQTAEPKLQARTGGGAPMEGPDAKYPRSVGAQTPQSTGMMNVLDRVGTQGVKGVTGVLGMPAAIDQGLKDLVNPVADKFQEWIQGGPMTPQQKAAADKWQKDHTLPIPSSHDMNDAIFNKLGFREVNGTTPAGKMLDSGIQAVSGAALLGPMNLPRSAIPAFTGGVGSEIGGQMTEGTKWEPLSRLLGGVVGGGVGAGVQYGGEKLYQGAKNLVEPFTDTGRTRIAGEAIRKSTTDPLRAVRNIDDATSNIPGVVQTGPKAANDPGLLAMENVVSGTPGKGGEFALRNTANNQARLDFAQKVQSGNATAQTVSDFFADQINNAKQQLTDAERRSMIAVQQKLAALPSGATADQAGQIIREGLQANSNSISAVRHFFDKVLYPAANESQTIINTDPVLQTIADKLRVAKGDVAGAVEKARQTLFVGKAPDTSVEGLQGSRQALNAMISDAQRSGNKIVAKELLDIRDALDKALQAAPELKLANDMHGFNSRPLDPFKSQQAPDVNNVLNRDQFNKGYVTPESMVPGRFFRPGPQGAAGMDQLIAAAGDNPQLLGAVQNYAVQQMKAAALDANGQVSATKLNAWLNSHGPALDRLPPSFRDSIKDVASAQATLDGISTHVGQGVSQLAASPAGKFVAADPSRAVSSALGAKDSVTRLAALASEAAKDQSGEALNGLRRGIVDDFLSAAKTTATDNAGNPVLSSAAAVRWMENNKAAIGEVLTPEQVRHLQSLVDDLKVAARSAPKMAGSDTMRNLSTSRFLENSLGSLGKSDIARQVVRPLNLIYGPQDIKIQERLIEMLLDPNKTKLALGGSENAIMQQRLAQALKDQQRRQGTALGVATGPMMGLENSQR